MSDISYDPYSAINDPDPYPLYRRLREEAPLYYNEQYDFYAVSRYEDCERGLVDAKRFISRRGGILELIKADIEFPPGHADLRGPARPHRPSQPAVARVHAPTRRRPRAEDP